jgi:hypothetical protein
MPTESALKSKPQFYERRRCTAQSRFRITRLTFAISLSPAFPKLKLHRYHHYILRLMNEGVEYG